MDGGLAAAANNQWFFEVAWEVANKGIIVLVYWRQSISYL